MHERSEPTSTVDRRQNTTVRSTTKSVASSAYVNILVEGNEETRPTVTCKRARFPVYLPSRGATILDIPQYNAHKALTMDPLPEPSSSSIKRPTAAYSSLPELAKPFYVDPSERSYRHQYANIYFVRLVELRPVVEQAASDKWSRVRGELDAHSVGMACACLKESDVIGKPPLLPRILNVQRSQLCYIVGTVYMDMPLKPNVLEDMARDVSCRTAHFLTCIAHEIALDRSSRTSTQVLLCTRRRAPRGRVGSSATSRRSHTAGEGQRGRRAGHWYVSTCTS
jgi:hypothetical protein